MAFRTVNELFFEGVSRAGGVPVRYKHEGEWRSMSAQQFYSAVLRMARALESWGLKKGDRVALLAENRPEWAIVDFACLAMGLVDVPIYATLTAEQASFILQDSGARVIVVSTAEQLKKVQSVASATALERIVTMDRVPDAGPNVICMQDVVPLDAEPLPRDPSFDRRALSAAPDDLMTIIYTSGTTGRSKGVMLTHGNLASNLACSGDSTDWRQGDVMISFLPLSHITARHVDYLCFQNGVTLVYCPNFDALFGLLREVKPHIFVTVPRLLEKVRQEVERRANSGAKRFFLRWALRVGRRNRKHIMAGRTPSSLFWWTARKLVYERLGETFGGRVRNFTSGGAPLGAELAGWYADMGIRIFEGYGLTETSPVIAVNKTQAYKLGTVGKPLPNLECRIAEDGELLVRGPNVFRQYWNNAEETKNAFDGEWFKTGDIGVIDADGFLSITDRKKDLIKTSGGKFIAPQPIEGRLKASPFVAQACVIGDRRKFASVVISPNLLALREWAAQQGIAASSDEQLIAEQRVRALYEDIVSGVNASLAQFEKLKKVLVLPVEFAIATGELTPTLKLKRRVIEQKYKPQIDSLYAEGAHMPDAVAVL